MAITSYILPDLVFPSPISRLPRRAALASLIALALLSPGCSSLTEYLNPRNSFLDPSQVGRFDKGNYTGHPGPVKWPILDSLDVIDEPAVHWTTAVEPSPDDLNASIQEYQLGPGDVITISIFELIAPGQESVQARQINELGDIKLEGLGPIHAGGITPSQLEEKLAQTLVDRHIMQPKGEGQLGPQVTVSVQSSQQRNFSILGTNRAGTYNILRPDFRLLDALAITGDVIVQPGLEYIYVIRNASSGPESTTATPGANATPPGAPSTGPTTSSAADALEAIEHGTSQPAGTTSSDSAPAAETVPDSSTSPSSAPDTTLPASGPATTQSSARKIGHTPVAALAPERQVLADALDNAMGGVNVPATATSQEAGGSTQEGPGMGGGMEVDNANATTASQPQSSPPTHPQTNPQTNPDQDLLQHAIAPSSQPTVRYIYQDGHYVAVAGTTLPEPATGVAGPTSEPEATPPEAPAVAGAMPRPAPAVPVLTPQRVLRIPLAALKEGLKKYNVVIRPGDFIVVPTIDSGLYYLMGNIARPGAYTLSGQRLTLKQAVASAGGLGPLAIPRRCDLIRRIGENEEVTVRVNLQAIFDGEQPDMYLKSNDVLNIGTDFVAPFLNITRNAYRFSYGLGFVYDANFAPIGQR